MTPVADHAVEPTPTVDHDAPGHVTVVGEDIAVVALPERGDTDDDPLPTTTLETGFSCDTGTSAAGEWYGVPVTALLDRAPMPEDTTHLVFRARDGFQVCVPVSVAIEGLVATRLDGEAISDAETRVVAPALESTRSLRDVTVLRAVHLDPGEDRADYESL